MKLSEALRLRSIIERAMDGEIDDATALEATNLFKSWSGDSVKYEINTRVRYNNNLYKCITAHTSQSAWTPTDAPSLWARVLIPDSNVIPAWEQPDSTNGYNYGDKVTHNGKTWVSTYEGSNVWEPGAAGTENLWEEVVEEDSTNSDTDKNEETGSNDEQVSAWTQPDSTNPYQIGDRVSHNGSTWECNTANNVWEPGAYGWTKVE